MLPQRFGYGAAHTESASLGCCSQRTSGAPVPGCPSSLPQTDPHLGLEGSLGQGAVNSGSLMGKVSGSRAFRDLLTCSDPFILCKVGGWVC